MFQQMKHARDILGEIREAEQKEQEEELNPGSIKKPTGPLIPSVNDLDGGDFVQTWKVELDGKTTLVVFHRNNFQVLCDGEAVLCSIRNSSINSMGSVISFMIGNHMAQISSGQDLHQQNNVAYSLIVDGRFVPTDISQIGLEERF